MCEINLITQVIADALIFLPFGELVITRILFLPLPRKIIDFSPHALCAHIVAKSQQTIIE